MPKNPDTIRPLARSNVTIRQLRAFVAVAQQRNFTAAAGQISITQSALSALVRELETEIGVRLFDRTTRSVDLTAAGRDFLPVAQRILHDLQNGLEIVRDLSLKRRGSITVAATPMLAASLVAQVCAAFSASHPGILLTVKDRLSHSNLQSLRAGEVDLAIGTFVSSEPDITFTKLSSDRLGAVLSRSHPLAQKRQLRWADLAGIPLIVLNQESSYRLIVEQAMLRAGLPHEPAYEVGYMGTAIGMAQAGLGVAVCPSYVRRTVDTELGRYIPLVTPVVSREISIATLAGRSPSPAVETFMANAALLAAKIAD
jgi:DNA-binding transcriptional LysR family regulator